MAETEIETLKRENQRLRAIINQVISWDEGLLGGDNSWSVGDWHNYLRGVIRAIQFFAARAIE